jgi:hypothetical protein
MKTLPLTLTNDQWKKEYRDLEEQKKYLEVLIKSQNETMAGQETTIESQKYTVNLLQKTLEHQIQEIGRLRQVIKHNLLMS